MSNVARRKLTATTSIHIMALDGIVNVNSLFTLALFLGLTWYPNTDPATALIGSTTSCTASVTIAQNLVACHVYSFSSFLFSSLIALALKQGINVFKGKEAFGIGVSMVHVNVVALRVGILVSGLGSVFGCGFLTLALVDLVQIKLGTLACGSSYSYAAVGPLVTLVPLALVIYVFLVIYAFTR